MHERCMDGCKEGWGIRVKVEIYLVLSILQNLVVSLLILLDCLLQLDAVDFDAELGMCEVPHKMEHIIVIHLLALQSPCTYMLTTAVQQLMQQKQ